MVKLLTELCYTEGVAVFDNKGKLVISTRMVIGWDVFLMCKKIKIKIMGN